MEYVKKVAEEIVKDGLITREFADKQIQELQITIQKDSSQSQKQGDASRLFLMNLFKLGKLSITQLPHYAEKLQLMDNKPASGGAAAGGAVGGAAQPPQQLMTSQVSQDKDKAVMSPRLSRFIQRIASRRDTDFPSGISPDTNHRGSPPQQRRSEPVAVKTSDNLLQHSMSLLTMKMRVKKEGGATESYSPLENSSPEISPVMQHRTLPNKGTFKLRKKQKSESNILESRKLEDEKSRPRLDKKSDIGKSGEHRTVSNIAEIPQPFLSVQSTSQSNPIFKVFDLNKDDGQRKLLQFVFSASIVQYIVRGKRPIEITFEEITHHDVSDGQIIISTPDQTYQLGLSDISEQDKLKKCLASIGHDDDLSLVEENVLMQGYLDKKGPSYAIATKKRFVRVTRGKLSYYKMDSSQNYEAPLNTIVLNTELNEVKRFANDGFSIVSKNKEEKEFSFMIPKGKLKVDDIIEKREGWIIAIKQAYETEDFPSTVNPAIQRGCSAAGTHLINLAKQQLDSMLVILKEYEAEDECAAQASKMHQLFNDIERKLIQSATAAQQVVTPVSQYPTPKRDLNSSPSPSAEDLQSLDSRSSTSSLREEPKPVTSSPAAYEDVDIRPPKDRTNLENIKSPESPRIRGCPGGSSQESIAEVPLSPTEDLEPPPKPAKRSSLSRKNQGLPGSPNKVLAGPQVGRKPPPGSPSGVNFPPGSPHRNIIRPNSPIYDRSLHESPTKLKEPHGSPTMSRKQQSEDSGGLSDRRENGARQETVSDRELISRGHMSREVHDREHHMRAGNEFPSNEFKSYKSSSVQHSVNGVLPNSIELESECKKDDMNVEVSLKCEVFPPTPPTRTSSKAKKIEPLVNLQESPKCPDINQVPDTVDAPPIFPDFPPPPGPDPVYETTIPVQPPDPVYNDLDNYTSAAEKEAKNANHVYTDVAKKDTSKIEATKIEPAKILAPVAPVIPTPPPPRAPMTNVPPPPAPGFGPPRPPSASILANASAKSQPKVVPKVKVLPLHWQRIPPISFKKSVWNELTDVSPLIDVLKLEEYFATKPSVVKDLNKNSKALEKQALLDPKRSQNIGIFLHGTGILPNSVSELVSRIKNGDIKENINSLKKLCPTNDDMKVFSKVPESTVLALDKADQLMWYMVNTPFFTQRLNIIEVTTSIPDDIEDIKSMIDNILEVSRVLLSSASFLRFLEKILTIGNMMNAAIKKTSPGFKLSSTLPKLASIRSSRNKAVSLLDFIVEQVVLLDGESLKFVNDIEIVHSASQYASIVSLSADVDIMKQDMNKLTGRANEISQKCPHDHPGFHDVETFVDDVRSFVKFFQQTVFILGEQSAQMKGDFSKVLERFGESPNTDSEEFLKMLSEFQTQLVDSIKRCPQDLPACVAHLKPKPKPVHVPKAKMVAQLDIANSLKRSTLFQRSQTEASIPVNPSKDHSWT